MEVMVKPLAAILVELAVMVLPLEVTLVQEMVVKPIMELGEMPMVEVILRTEMGRIMVIKLLEVMGMAEAVLLRVGMVEMLLLVITPEVMVEMPTAEMGATGMVVTAEMKMVGMAEVETVTVTVTQETQMTKPMIKKS
jgi:hypothetical protein